jgi:hypothetical protein
MNTVRQHSSPCSVPVLIPTLNMHHTHVRVGVAQPVYIVTTDWTFDPLQMQRNFPLACIQTSSEAHSAFFPMGTCGPFHDGKARPRRDADHSPPYTAKVKNEYKLYLLSPTAAAWRLAGQLY